MRNLLLTSFVSLGGLLGSGLALAEKFHFVAIGDTAYNHRVDLPIYDTLIQAINQAAPSFTIHVGDTWGVMPCTEKNHEWVRGWFDKYQHPVVYTPGDNEWTDCREPYVLDIYTKYLRGVATPEEMAVLARTRSLDGIMSSDGYGDTLGSLALIRKVFFSKSQSQGGVKMPLLRQPDVSPSQDTVENATWVHGDVRFVTLHVPGSQNGFALNDEARTQEALARNRANIEWLKYAFGQAEESAAPAIVVALHAGMFDDERGGEFTGKAITGGFGGPFHHTVQAVRDLSEAFGKPVLLINGDFHEFVIDRPFAVSQGEIKKPRYGNITRLQVYGAPELRAVRIDVDTSTPWVFSFAPLYVE